MDVFENDLPAHLKEELLREMRSSGPTMTQSDFEPDESKVKAYLANIEEGDRAAILELLPPSDRPALPEPVATEEPVTLSQEIEVPSDIDMEGEVFKSFAPEVRSGEFRT